MFSEYLSGSLPVRVRKSVGRKRRQIAVMGKKSPGKCGELGGRRAALCRYINRGREERPGFGDSRIHSRSGSIKVASKV